MARTAVLNRRLTALASWYTMADVPALVFVYGMAAVDAGQRES